MTGRQPGDLVALRTLAWHMGMIGKGCPVPADVPEGVLREWHARGWLQAVPAAPDAPDAAEVPPAPSRGRRKPAE